MEAEKSIKVKIVLIGDGAVGKTSIAKRYLQKGYSKEYLRTIGAEFYNQARTYDLEPGKIKIQWMIWDLGGQPSFNEVRGMYYKGAKAAILVYDITRPQTYHNLPEWVNEFFENAGDSYPILLAANKVDLRGKCNEEVTRSMGEKYASTLSDYIGFNVPHMETSAKDNENIEKLFNHLAKLIVKWAEKTSRL